MFQDEEIKHRLQYRLDKKCSNNQAEMLAILKATEKIHEQQKENNKNSSHQYRQQDKLNMNNHNPLVEKLRETLTTLILEGWTVEISWIKAYVGILGNEEADRTAKRAALNEDLQLKYNKIPLSVVTSELQHHNRRKWEDEWEKCTNGSDTKYLSPE